MQNYIDTPMTDRYEDIDDNTILDDRYAGLNSCPDAIKNLAYESMNLRLHS